MDGKPTAVSGQGERALLALLACSAGRVVTVDRLIDDLWGERLPANPANALQLRVSKLRRQLGDVITTTPAGYRLDVDPDDVDSLRFERLVATRRFDEALALRRETALASFFDHHWARAESARLEELYLSAVEQHTDDRLQRGDDVALVSDLEALVAAHPLRERLRGQLMVALHRNGCSAEALARYQEFRRLLVDELGLDPSPALQDLEGAILRQDPALDRPASPRPATNLPVRLSSFVGRAVEVQRVVDALDRSRLVTLTGPGGVGKTSLAVEASRRAAGSYRDGVWFVALAGVSEPARVAPAIADAVGVGDRGPQPDQDLVAAWLSQRQALVVLDNCEHLVDACADVVEHVLRSAAPGAGVLATSREALGVAGEVQLPVPSMADDEAVALFCERAAAVDPGFAGGERAAGADHGVVASARAAAGEPGFAGGEQAELIGRLCRRLDGMPLAIELAAARVKLLPVAEIAERLDDRFRLLTGGPRTAEARHRTLRATVDWSHDLLDEPHRALLRRLSVFRGGWTLEAAEQVCAGGPVPAGDILGLTGDLVDRSLAIARDGRFRLLETIRQYAAERLAEAGEEESSRERHARWFVDLAERAETDLRGPSQARWLERLRAEDDNLGQALAWCRQHAGAHPDLGLRLAGALGWYWYVGRQVDGRRELAAALASGSGGSDLGRGRVLQALSLALRPAGCIVHPSAEAAGAAAESLALLDGAGDAGRAAISRLLVAVEGVGGADVAGNLDQVAAARSQLRALGDQWGQALADFVEMEIRLRNGDDGRALPLGQSAAEVFEALGDDWGRSAVPMHLGAGLRLVGRTAEAVEVLERALAVCRAARLENNVARVCAELGGAAADQGDAAGAERWFAECERVATGLANDTMLTLAWLGFGTVARLREDPAEAERRFAAALEVASRAGVALQSAVALTGVAAAQLDRSELAGAGASLDRAAEAAAGVPDAGVRAAVLEQRARLATGRGRPAEGAALVAEAGALREAANRPRTVLERRDVAGAGEAAPA